MADRVLEQLPRLKDMSFVWEILHLIAIFQMKIGQSLRRIHCK